MILHNSESFKQIRLWDIHKTFNRYRTVHTNRISRTLDSSTRFYHYSIRLSDFGFEFTLSRWINNVGFKGNDLFVTRCKIRHKAYRDGSMHKLHASAMSLRDARDGTWNPVSIEFNSCNQCHGNVNVEST